MKRGFTLIEVLMVVLIIAILATISFPTLQGAFIKAKISETYADVSQIERAFDLYILDEGRFTEAYNEPVGGDHPLAGYDMPVPPEGFGYRIDYDGVDTSFIAVNTPGMATVQLYRRELQHGTGGDIISRRWLIKTAHEWAKYVVLPNAGEF